MIDKLKLFRKDILVTPIDKNEVYNSIIHVVESEEQREELNFFKVLKISKEVTEVVEGDIILLGMGKHTPPTIIDGIRVAITSENDVEAVIEI